MIDSFRIDIFLNDISQLFWVLRCPDIFIDTCRFLQSDRDRAWTCTSTPQNVAEKIRAYLGVAGYLFFCRPLPWWSHGLFFAYFENIVNIKLTKIVFLCFLS